VRTPPPTPDAPRVAVAASQRADRTTVGTAVPGSGTPYNWFFPTSTRLTLVGQQGSQYRVRLTDDLSVWVDTAEVDLLPAGTASPSGYVNVVTAIPQTDYVDIRLGTSDRFPFQVEGRERGVVITVYGAETRTNILQYGRTDPLIQRMDWEQVSDDLYRVTVDLSEPLWGFQPSWDDRGNLIVRINRAPRIDPANPLRGIHIAVDAGHPPGGAIGPTRLTEAEATLAVAKRLIPLLRAAGAQVTEIRPDMSPIDVNERVRMTTAANPDLFVSIHFDAFGDGTNPYRNYGSHVLFNQPQSVELARAVQPELLQTFGLPDLGIRRQDVAVIRNPAMPAILTETMFMMFPEQEAALRNPESLQRIAEGHVRGIEAFLRSRATAR
jgi:N-acetylmuramoyl-L-alanine amidase